MNDGYLVTQSNNLIDARYHEPLTARQQKVILSIVSMVQPSDEDFKSYEIRIRDFHGMLGLKGDPKYTELRSITQKILKKSLEIKKEEGRVLQVNWFSSIEYFEHEGRMEFSFDPKLKPYLLDLKMAFTSYRLSNILSLKGSYSIRLYELLKKWQVIGSWEFSINDLKGKFGISEERYKQYGHFKSRIIEPAIKELNKKTDLQVTFKEIRKVRKVVKIKFNIKHLKEKEISISTSDESIKRPKSDGSLFEQLGELTEGYELPLEVFTRIEDVAKKIYGKSDYIEQLEQLVKNVNLGFKQGKIDNPVGLMVHIIKSKERLASEGHSPKMERQQFSEAIPDWFKDRHKPKIKEEKTVEELATEEAERKKIEELMKSI